MDNRNTHGNQKGPTFIIVVQDGKNYKKVLVVGGTEGSNLNTLKSTELFDIATQTWSRGVNIPIGNYGGSLVYPSESSKYAAFLVGGVNAENGASHVFTSSKIYAFYKNLEQWVEVAGTFSQSRSKHVSLQIPENMTGNCRRIFQVFISNPVCSLKWPFL